jgi:hypothetical protein
MFGRFKQGLAKLAKTLLRPSVTGQPNALTPYIDRITLSGRTIDKVEF